MTSRICYSLYFEFIFLICITVAQVSSVVTSPKLNARELAEQGDQVALLAFKKVVTQDPYGVLNSWNGSRHFCRWDGITCGRRHRRVTVLDLSSKGLTGSLSPYIGNLSFLRIIDLSNNSIQGDIPHEFGRLFRLEAIYLANNSLTGEISANLSHCSRLTSLFLGRNKLIGNIPIEFVSLYNLKLLALHWNDLTGGIPSFLGNISSLVKISLAYNSFGGNIPNSWGRLKELTSLGLGGNNLSGAIPSSIYNLSSLANCSLAQNQLHGSLPASLGLTLLPNLQLFQISLNFFHGPIPTSLSNASKLEYIDMGGNYFSGKLSVDFGGMKHLFYLTLWKNNLGSEEGDDMSFISSLTNCSTLQFLLLSENQFRGPLPHSVGNLSNQLQQLNIDRNQLRGSIPPGIGNLVNLYLLGMELNQFSGKIPEEMGKLQNLQWLALHHNQLSGEIPSSLGNISSLNEIHLNNNKLSGVIPSSLGNLKGLAILHLFQNDLGGNIPQEIFDITYLSISLNLGQNHLVGSVPPKIGNLNALRRFDVLSNNLSGEIPSELGLCSNLEMIYMAGNSFSGSIPSTLNSLKGIRELDLSDNNLSGQIPKFLQSLPLEYLNLSFNDLEGEVPTNGIFQNASAISVASNSNRLCGGIAALKLPKCTDNSSSKQKISRVVKILISTVTSFSGLVMVSIFIFCWLKKRGAEQPSSGSLMGKSLLRVSYKSLLKATDGFSSTHLLGVGNFGSVYKGTLGKDGTVVAIKVLNLQRQGASKSFMAECKALRNIRHRNLVRVITSCSSVDYQGNDFKAIVYEYMPNGSLDQWLHPDQVHQTEGQFEIRNLTLLQRINIAIDVASSIDYLHHNCQEPILHCDLKPSNVLLGEDMTAHVGDFGLARFRPEVSNPNQSSSVGVRGTIGYAAPEYGLGSEVSKNGDVYSYGILLLEMATGKKPTGPMFEGDFNLHSFARAAFPDRVLEIVDPTLLNADEDLVAADHTQRQARIDNRSECLISLVKIGVACSMGSPQDRMKITDALRELKSLKKILLPT